MENKRTTTQGKAARMGEEQKGLQKKRNILLSAGGAVLILIIVVAALVTQTPGGAADPAGSDAAGTLAQEINTGESLVIPTDEISETANFYPVTVDGTRMEVLAVKAPDGTIRTAFNTCQVCFDSGRGYYEQDGDVLVCQNCGNRFQMSQVEIESGGCNPWPIFDDNKTAADDTIMISYDFLKESKQIFENWK